MNIISHSRKRTNTTPEGIQYQRPQLFSLGIGISTKSQLKQNLIQRDLLLKPFHNCKYSHQAHDLCQTGAKTAKVTIIAINGFSGLF
tara:strand:- start:113 stop:373 length:261 start_codon:yes stop_codon:yes gene_type:complete